MGFPINMVPISLKKLHLLVLDSSQFTLDLFAQVGRNLGIGRTTVINNSTDAIAFIKQHSAIGSNVHFADTIDLLITDWDIEPISGLNMLKWVREERSSPNRFMPVVMSSPFPTGDMVAETRNNGAEDFLAKPFSVKMMTDRLLSIINDQRGYILTSQYFGPERRRRAMYTAKERRDPYRPVSQLSITKELLESNLQDYLRDAKVISIARGTPLKEKLLGGGVVSEAVGLDQSLLVKAEGALARMGNDYADWSFGLINLMYKELGNLTMIAPEKRAFTPTAITPMKKLQKIANQMRGEGSTFGYPLISKFGNSLHAYGDMVFISQHLVALLQAHLDAIRIVLKDKIKESESPEANQLVKMLEMAKRKYDATTESETAPIKASSAPLGCG